MTVDTPIPFSVHRLWYELTRYVCSTYTAPSANQSEQTEAIGKDGGGNGYKATSWAMVPSPTFGDLDAQPEEDLDRLLFEWIGGEKPVAILDLSGVPVSILTDLIGVLLRLLFDALFWARHLPEGGRSRPLLVVLEEAHAYLSASNEGTASMAARRIVKEGRKYGLGAMIVSQRPSEIGATILSQCGTMFAMRPANASDRSQVTGTVMDSLEGLFNMLPALRTGEAIVVGEAVHLPLRALIDAPALNRRPDSH